MTLNPSSTGKIEKKNSTFEVLIIPQTLNINKQRTTSAKSINLDIFKKLIKYSFKKLLVKEMSLTVFGILLFEGKLVL